MLCLTPPHAPNEDKTVPAESHTKKLDALNTVQVCKHFCRPSGPIFFPQLFFNYEFTSQQVLNCQEVTDCSLKYRYLEH